MGRAVPLLPLYAFVAMTRTTLPSKHQTCYCVSLFFQIMNTQKFKTVITRFPTTSTSVFPLTLRLFLCHCSHWQFICSSEIHLSPLFTPVFSLCWHYLFRLSPAFFIVPTSLFWLRIIRKYLCFYLWNLRSVLCFDVIEDRALTRLWIYGKQREDLWDGHGRYESSYNILVGETEEKKPAVKIWS